MFAKGKIVSEIGAFWFAPAVMRHYCQAGSVLPQTWSGGREGGLQELKKD